MSEIPDPEDLSIPSSVEGERRFRCVSCGTHFSMDVGPSYCPGCGNARNERFGMGVAKSNPNITGFITQ